MQLEDLTRNLRVLAEPLRVRLLHLLDSREASVSDLVEVLGAGQSTVSTQLGRLAEEGLVEARRAGRFLLYRAALEGAEFAHSIVARYGATEAAREDLVALEQRLAARAGPAPAELIGDDYLPGRTWEALARGLLAWVPSGEGLVDIGVGRGDLTLLLAPYLSRVIAIDPDTAALRRLEARAEAMGLSDRIETREGSVEDLPLEPGEVSLCLLSQVLHLVEEPAAALASLGHHLAPQARLLLFDLNKHREAWVQDRLGHRHCGFEPRWLEQQLKGAGFDDVHVARASRDSKPPRFITLMATGTRRSS